MNRLRWLPALLSACLATQAWAAPDVGLEQRLRAAFLINFAKFVGWPDSRFASPDSPLLLCVPAAHAVTEALQEAAKDKAIAGRPLQVQLVAARGDWQPCHLAYLGPNPSAELLLTLAANSTLTVHEADRALPGGMIRLYLDQKRMRFEVNTAATGETLQFSAKLLSMATLTNSDGLTLP